MLNSLCKPIESHVCDKYTEDSLTLLGSQLLIHMGWHHPVVKVVVVVVALLLRNRDLTEPLDHATTNEAWDDHPHREAMIRG